MILRSCNNDFTSAHDSTFQWPNTIGDIVVPKKWNPAPECGDGLHGFLFGEGNLNLADWSESAQWIVFEGEIIVKIDDYKVKTNKATILHIGEGKTALERFQDCHAFMRHRGTLGPRAFNKIESGGDNYVFTGGDRCTFTGGNGCTFTGGYRCTFTGGDDCTFTGSDDCIFTGGDDCTFIYKYFCLETYKYRTNIARTGENGILPNITYQLNQNGDMIPV